MAESKCVLLVDDEEEIVSFMERFLKRFKIETVKALSGEEALTLFDPNKVEFVFLDIRMKGIDGISVLKELKNRAPGVKVIIITGSSGRGAKDTAMELGALDYISKPLDLAELKEKIEKYVIAG